MLTVLVNLVIAITLAEIFWLMFMAKHRLPKLPLLANLSAGLGLLAALRLNMAGADLPWVALALAAAGAAHLLDLKARWKAAAGDAFNG
jgi:hypothetical protein